MANNKGILFDKLFSDIKTLCITEEKCGHCLDESCLIGYARLCVGSCARKDMDSVPGGSKDVPGNNPIDGIDMEKAISAIAHTLLQCKSCREEHTEDCIINIVRNCYEVLVLGKKRDYNGSTLMYLTELDKENPFVAPFIQAIYKGDNTGTV